MKDHIDIIMLLVDEIEEGISNDLTIKKLSDTVGLSPWHLQRLFKSIVGDTLGSYVRGRRLALSVEMLSEANLGIIDIAIATGFSSHEAFTRSFKEYYNLTPKEFRKSKPYIQTNRKPMLRADLYSHICNTISKEPDIVVQKEINLVGFDAQIQSPFSSNRDCCGQLFNAWSELFKNKDSIENKVDDQYYGVTLSPSGFFNEEELQYIAGVPVGENKGVKNTVVHKVDEKLTAKFCIDEISHDNVNMTIDYIYGFWLPNSDYIRDSGNDYEVFSNVGYTGDLSTADLSKATCHYVIPIRSK